MPSAKVPQSDHIRFTIPDSTRLVSASEAIGELGHCDWVAPVTFSPKGMCIASGSRDNHLSIMGCNIRHSHRRTCKDTLTRSHPLRFPLNGTRIASCAGDNVFRFWDVTSGTTIGDPLYGPLTGSHPLHSPLTVHWSSPAPLITPSVMGCSHRRATARTLHSPPIPMAHKSSPGLSAFSPDGTRIISGSRDGTIQLWDAALGTALGEPLKGHFDWVTSVAFSPKGTHVISGSSDNTV